MMPIHKSWPPNWKVWIQNIILAAVIAFGYANGLKPIIRLILAMTCPSKKCPSLLGAQSNIFRGLALQNRFYALIWIHSGALHFWSPCCGPAVGLILLHMTVPEGHGVDRSWSGHCHHMAPAVAFAVSATTIGAASIASIYQQKTIWTVDSTSPQSGRRGLDVLLVAEVWSGYYNLQNRLLAARTRMDPPCMGGLSVPLKQMPPIVSKYSACQVL